MCPTLVYYIVPDICTNTRPEYEVHTDSFSTIDGIVEIGTLGPSYIRNNY